MLWNRIETLRESLLSNLFYIQTLHMDADMNFSGVENINHPPWQIITRSFPVKFRTQTGAILARLILTMTVKRIQTTSGARISKNKENAGDDCRRSFQAGS